MIKYYNSLSWRLGTRLKTREPAVSSDGTIGKLRSTKSSWLFNFCMTLLLLAGFSSNAQLSIYSFTQTSGTFTPTTASTFIAGSNGADSFASPLTAIGFNFVLDGVTYTQFSASSNGWIRLGTAASAFATTPISTANNGPAIAFFSRDARTGTGGITYELSGSSPNRVLTIEYLNHQVQWNSVTNLLSVQIKLFETSNNVQIVYGPSSKANTYTGQVGIVGTATSNYSNRTTTSNWSATTAGVANNNTMTWNTTVGPADGLTYTWAPPVACTGTPDAGTAAALSSSSCTGGISGATATGLTTGTGISYQWETSPDDLTWSDVAGATTATLSTTTLTGLNYYRLVTTCAISGLSNETNSVSIEGVSCGSINLPATGSSTVSCGTNTLLYDVGGPSGDYTNSNSGFVVLENSGTGVITLSGSIIEFETCCDGLRIYSGVGTGGTLLATLSAAGAITPIVSDPGQALTVQLFSDGSVVRAGIALQAIYSGTCASCSGTPGSLTATFPSTTTANLSWTAPSPAPADGYEWAVTTSATPPTSGTATTDLTAVAGSLLSGETYYLHVRSVCETGVEVSNWSTSSPFSPPLVTAVPWTEGFATTTLPAQWTNNTFTVGSVAATGGNPGNTIYKNLYSFATTGSFVTPNLGTIASNQLFSFDYRLADFGDPNDPPAIGSGNFVVEISTDYGATYTTLETVVNDGVAGWRNKSYSLAAYNGLDVKIRITGNWISGDYYLAFDNFEVAALCAGTPDGGLVSVASQSVCPAFPLAPITVTGASVGGGVTYQWEESVDGGTSWANATGGSGETTLSYQPPVFAGVTILYRLKVTCPASGLDAFSDNSEVNQNPKPVPFIEDFSDLSTLVGWSTTGFGVGATRGATGNPGDNAFANLYSFIPTGQITTAKHGPVQAGQAIVFDYQLTNFASPFAAAAADSGTIEVSVSTNCGTSFTVVDSFNNDGTAGYQTKVISLGDYVGDDVLVRIAGTWITGDFDLSIDNFGIIVPPPAIVSFDPLAVCEESGSLVTVTGDFFNDASEVTLGATSVPFTVVDVNTITFNLPSGGATGAISVTTPGGTATSTLDLTVNANPVVNPITGADTALCMPNTLLLSSTSPGGTWSSSDDSIATVVGGTVTGVSEGTVTINYSVTDNGCTTVVTYNVDINEPVVISSFTPSQTVVTGNDATYSVVATGTGLTYQWFAFDGIDTYTLDDVLSLAGESYSGATTSTLVVGSVPGDLNGFEFYCEVTGVAPCSPETTIPSSILNVGDTGIESDPSNVTLCDGGTTTFTVVRSGDDLEEDITYSWEYDADGTDNWQPVADGDLDGMTIADSDTSILSVSTITLIHDGYRFRATVTGPANAAISNPATLTVNEGVSVSSQPNSALVCRVDSTVNFSVTAGGDVAGIQWESSPNGLDTWTSVGTGSSLDVIVSPATPVGVTYYRAVVSGNSPCLPVESDVVTLTVQQPTIEVTPSSATYCLPGDAVNLTASGAISYTWSPAIGLDITEGASVNASPSVTTVYTVTGTDGNGCTNTTTVTVTVSDAVSASASADLEVVCPDADVQLSGTGVQAFVTGTLNGYEFVSTTSTYESIVGQTGTVAVTTTSMDDAISATQTLPFNFSYGGNSFNQFRINTNGWLGFGAPTSGTNYNSLSGTINNVIAAFSRDLNGSNTVSTSYYVQTTGTSPNRITKVEWVNLRSFSGGVNPQTANFQVWLYENTNVVEIRYGEFTTAAGRTTVGTAQVGLRGASSAAVNVRSLANTGAWSSPTVGTSNSATCALGNFASPILPDNGRVYRFTPGNAPAYTYSWSSEPAGFTSTEQNPIANPSVSTSYSVVITNAEGCSDTATVDVEVISGATIETQPVAVDQCEGTDASFSVVASGPSVTYQWRKDGVDIDGATAATLELTAITGADDASYDVVITPACGDSVTSDAVALTVNLLPTAGASNSGVVCEGGDITLSATSDIAGSTYEWSGPDGFASTEQNPVLSNVTLANVGEYTVVVTSPAVCSSTASTFVNVNANAPLEISVSGSETTACVGELKELTASANSTGSVVVSFGTNLESNGVGAATFPATISGIPAGAIVSSAELQFTNVNSINGSWRSEIRVALSGAHTLGATQISTLGSGGLIDPDPTVNVPGFTATSGVVNLLLSESFNDGGAAIDATFGSAVLVINYALPAPDVTWTPATDLFTDEAGTVPYAGGFATTVYAKVSATSPTSYTASSVNVLGCEREATYSYTLTATGCPSTTNVQPSQCGVTLAAVDSYVFANLVSGAQGYRFRVTDMTTNEVQTIDRALRVFRITQLTNYAFNRTYMVEVAVRRNNVWESFYGTGCTVTTPDTTTQIRASQCNTTISNLNDAIFADIVPFATGYRFRVTNTLNPIDVQTTDRPIRDFRMSLLSDIQFNTTYNVEVAVRNTDGTYLSYGPVCNITTPLFPTVGLEDAQCDEYQVISNTEILLAESYPGVEQYRFLIENVGLGYSQTADRALRTVTLNNFTGLLPGTTYTVRVAIQLNGVFGPYGKSCSIITPGAGRPDEVTRMDENNVNEFKAIAFPNPFATSFAIDVRTSNTETVSLTVYDMAGRLLEVKEVKAQDATNYQFGDRYPSGVYNVIVTQGNETKTVRVVKQ